MIDEEAIRLSEEHDANEITNIKKRVFIREIVFAVLNGEYQFQVNDLEKMTYEEIEEAYTIMADYLKQHRHRVI